MSDRMKEKALRQLNQRLDTVLSGKADALPNKGWIRVVREVLGISLKQLADRIGVNHSTVAEYEQREAKGTITLNSLRKAAEALDCELTYALAPKNGDFEDLRERQARLAAERMVERTSRSMELEDQEVSNKEKEEQIEELKRELLHEWDNSIWDVTEEG